MTFGFVQTFGVLDILWTVAIEEQFYLFYPLTLRLLGRRFLLLLLIGILILIPAGRAVWVLEGFDPMAGYRFTLTRIDSLAFGALIGHTYFERGNLWTWLCTNWQRIFCLNLLGCGIIYSCTGLFYPSEPLVFVVGHTLLAAAFSSILVGCLHDNPSPMKSVFEVRWLRRVGLWSYGIYLLHWPIHQIMLAFFIRDNLTSPSHVGLRALFFIAGIAISIFAGGISFHLYEQKFLKLRKLFRY